MADKVEKKEEGNTEESAVTTPPEDTPIEEAPKAKAEAKPVKAKKAKAKDAPAPEKKETLKKKKIPKLDKVALFNAKYLRDDIPEFKAGDTLRIHYRIVEGDKTRIQAYEGVCIARKHGGVNETIKIRKLSGQIGVERTFFLHSKKIEKIEVKKIGKVRRAKIYFLRSRIGKSAKIREVGLH
jgi:large subunit ribosomal protein L19